MARRLGFDHNPLRRGSDVIEAWLLPAVIAVFLILGPFVAGAAGLWVHADNAAAQRAMRSWHQVPAVLLQAAPGPMMSDNGSNTWLVWTPARWTADGRAHAGSVPAPAGTRAGASVPVWLDRAGDVQVPPLTAAGDRDRVMVGMSLALGAFALLLAGLALLGQADARPQEARGLGGGLAVGGPAVEPAHLARPAAPASSRLRMHWTTGQARPTVGQETVKSPAIRVPVLVGGRPGGSGRARHFSAGRDARRPRQLGRRAAEVATGVFANQKAVRHYRRATELLRQAPADRLGPRRRAQRRRPGRVG